VIEPLRLARSWHLALGAAAALGCSERGEYSVTVRLPGDPARAARVEVAVLPSCDDVETPGDEPVLALRVTDAPGGEALGTVPIGRHALYARAWEADCTLYAAGCAPFEVEADTRGSIAVELREIPPRGCPAGESCDEGRCTPGADAGPDAGSRWILEDDSDADFAMGDPGPATVVEGGAVSLRSDQSSGVFTSRELSVPVPSARGLSIAWAGPAPYGKGLPGAAAGSAELREYAAGGLDVSALVFLLHLEGSPGASLRDGETVADASGRGHDAQVVDLTDAGDSVYRDGRIGGGAFVKRDDHLRIPDALVDEDFRFGTDDFTWAAWVRIDGCEASEDNVIALGGEIPHIWLGALCPEGVGLWQVHDDEGLGDGIRSVETVVDGQWHHLVGVKAAAPVGRTFLYVDGILAASQEQDYGEFGNFTEGLLIGNFPIGEPPFYTYRSELDVDEVAVFRRALSSDEVLGLHRRGALRLGLQVRACAAAGCAAEPFVGPDGSSDSFFTAEDDPTSGTPIVDLPDVVTGAVFQYRATFDTDVPGASPVLERVQMLVGVP